MKSIRLLNENDIKEIVAEKFETTKEKVGIAIKKVSKGYGMAEHEEHEIEIRVSD